MSRRAGGEGGPRGPGGSGGRPPRGKQGGARGAGPGRSGPRGDGGSPPPLGQPRHRGGSSRSTGASREGQGAFGSQRREQGKDAGEPPKKDPWPTDPPSPLTPPDSFLLSASGLGVEFEPGDVERLGSYLSLLLETTRLINLTAIRDPEDAWLRHVLDALTLLPLIEEVEPSGRPDEPDNQRAEGGASGGPGEEQDKNAAHAGSGPRLIDIGSGGGLPAIPLAIVRPDLQVTLVEATGKKARFLRHAAEALGLTNVRVLHDRAESIGQDGSQRERYDIATCRALGHMAMALELCLPLVRPGGLALLVKGQRADEELAEAAVALRDLGGHHAGTVETPTGRIVVVEKIASTPRMYPRRTGEPARAPIGLRQLRKKRERGSDDADHGTAGGSGLAGLSEPGGSGVPSEPGEPADPPMGPTRRAEDVNDVGDDF